MLGGRIHQEFSFHEKALSVRAFRQQVLAGNIANADTPHYKAKDVDFASALQSVLAGNRANNVGLSLTHRRHIEGLEGGGLAELKYRVPTQDSVDGNTVEMDVERAQFAENAIHYQAGLSFISHQIKMMTTALQNG